MAAAAETDPQATIVRNAAWVFAVQLTTRLANFLYFIFIAKHLGATEFGYLNIVLSIVTVFDVVGDIGLARFVLRKSSIDLDEARRFVEALTPLRLATAAIAYGLVVIQAWATYPPLVTQLTALVALGLFFTGPASIFEAVLQGRSRFAYICLAHAALTVVQIGTGLAVVMADGGVAVLAATFVLTNVAYVTVVRLGVARLGAPLAWRFDPALCRAALPQAAPYALIFGLFILSSRLEVLVLGWWHSGMELGLYGIAARMMDAALVVPLALGTVLAPNFTKYHHQSPERLAFLYARMFRLTLLFALPGAIAAVELADPVMTLLLTAKYDGVAALMQITFAAYPFAALYYLNLALLLGSERQGRNAVLIACLVAFQTLCAFVAIPSHGGLGAAAAFCVSMTVTGLASTLWVRRTYVGRAHLWRAAAPPLAGSAVLAIVVWSDGLAVGPWRDALAVLAFAACTGLLLVRLPLAGPPAEGAGPHDGRPDGPATTAIQPLPRGMDEA